MGLRNTPEPWWMSPQRSRYHAALVRSSNGWARYTPLRFGFRAARLGLEGATAVATWIAPQDVPMASAAP